MILQRNTMLAPLASVHAPAPEYDACTACITWAKQRCGRACLRPYSAPHEPLMGPAGTASGPIGRVLPAPHCWPRSVSGSWEGQTPRPSCKPALHRRPRSVGGAWGGQAAGLACPAQPFPFGGRCVCRQGPCQTWWPPVTFRSVRRGNTCSRHRSSPSRSVSAWLWLDT